MTGIYADWLRVIRDPRESVAPSLKHAMNVWLAAIVLSMAITSLAYYTYGLTAENVTLHLAAVLAEYVTLVALGYAFHSALRIYGVSSSFAATFSIYTVLAAPLAPFVTLASIPGVQRALLLTSEIGRYKSLPFIDLTRELWFAFNTLDHGVVTIVIAAVHPVVVAAGFLVVLPTFAVMASEHYGVDEPRIVRAVALGLAIFLPLIIAPVLVLVVFRCA